MGEIGAPAAIGLAATTTSTVRGPPSALLDEQSEQGEGHRRERQRAFPAGRPQHAPASAGS